MRRLKLLTLAVPVLVTLGCNDLTTPKPAGHEMRGPQRTLMPAARIRQVSAGYNNTCAVRDDGTLLCWGYDQYGQSTVPAGLTSVVQVSNASISTCALKADGTVVCWGYPYVGTTTVPAGLASVAQMSQGLGDHVCAVTAGGTVVCWGNNPYGEINVPRGLTSVVQVSAGGYHTCALKADGTVVCWGDAHYGGAAMPAGIASVIQVSAGRNHTCVLEADRTVVCWGSNTLINGNGDFGSFSGQATVPAGLGPVAQVSAGAYHTCALKTDGTVVCWGYNYEGQAAVPVGLTSVVQVSAGLSHTCALKTDGAMVCWGANESGQTRVPDALIDQTPPIITPTVAGTIGANGWYTSDVSVSWAVSDAESAVTSVSGCEQQSVFADTPALSLSCSATSAGGSATQQMTINRDATPPVITFAGNAGSYFADQTVTIRCSASDAMSGLASSTCPSASGSAASFGLGSHTLAATAADHAGLTASASATFTVSARTPPNMDACKSDGWRIYTRGDLSAFKNQGDCIQYVNTGK